MKEKVLIAGGSGLVGRRLTQLLEELGYQVCILSRSKRNKESTKYLHWDPSQKLLDKKALETDHLINLAGAGIADRPWTKSRKKELTDSRLFSTQFLLEEFKKNKVELKSYLGASAIGYYGDGGDSLQDETSPPVYASFMTNLCKDWELAHEQFESIVDRTSILRIGIVITTQGGAYPKMRMSFKVGLGTYFGSGQQYYSWIHIDDLCKMIIHFLNVDVKPGIFNAVSPNAITNKDFIKMIKKSLSIPGIVVPTPAFVLRTTMGQMSRVILDSNRVSSKKIEKTGFKFEFPNLELAIKDIETRSI